MKRAASGFTLMEVLLAVALTAIIVAALYSTFFLSRRAVDAVDNSLLKLQECRAVLDLLKRELESSLYDVNKSYTILKIEDRDFYGKQASQMVFTSFSPWLPGVAKITYTVEEKDGILTLKKKIEPAYGKAVETNSVDLIENIESFTIEAGSNGKWVKTWDTGVSKASPDDIRITAKVVTKKDESPVIVSDIARIKKAP